MSVPSQQTTVGLRELKSHLSDYVRQVKAGATVTITERGKPVGRLVPVEATLDEKLSGLVDSKVVAWSRQTLGPVEPPARALGNRMVADLLLEDRE